MIRFSIITISYNAACCIESTIQSILSQSYPGIEYIIIDGGSTDGTREIIQKYKDRITSWVSEPDKGIYDAMNKGLARATGDYVWFMNAGDKLHEPDIIQKIVASLQTEKEIPDILYGETALIDSTGKQVGMRRLKAPEKLTWKSFRWGMLVCHQSFIAKREIAPDFNTAYRLSADYDWCIQCLQKSSRIYNTHLILADYLEEGASTQNRKISLQERYEIMCKYYGKIPTIIRHGWFAIRFYTAKWLKGRV
ncbi:MAG: glycosyltransferase [Tannerellaceae bacterium]|nr:glycosyltransferase [Tannerellaceae bacterium]